MTRKKQNIVQPNIAISNLYDKARTQINGSTDIATTTRQSGRAV